MVWQVGVHLSVQLSLFKSNTLPAISGWPAFLFFCGIIQRMDTTNFGEHLMLDCYGADNDLLNSKELVLQLLTELPEKLGMHKLADPVVYFAAGNGDKDPGGWSGFVVIMESHIALHTFVGRGFLSADVYTCQNGMDQEFIINYFKETFKTTDIEINFVKRGTRYPTLNK